MEVLAKPWMIWAVIFFLMAALFGLAMRYFFIGEIPYFDYRHLLHAHSHVALLGWGYLLLSGALVFTFVKDRSRLKTYRNLFILAVIANLGMMLSFPFQGYGLYSIVFSTFHLLVSYGFAFCFLKDLSKIENTASVKLVRYSVYWMVLSSLGLWAIAPIAATFGKLHPLYFMSVQWFLHLQLNGWFVYSFLGLLVHFAIQKGFRVSISRTLFVVLNLSLIFTYALAVSWSTPIESLYYFNTIGVLLQGFAYFLILKSARFLSWDFLKIPNHWIDGMIYLGILSLLAKAIIQISLVIPEVAIMAFTIRMYVIGFIHLVMLGAITFGIGGLSVKNSWFPSNHLSKWAWTILSIGFISSEILLLGQGTLLWAKMGFIPHFHLLLFLSSALLPLALILLLIGMVTNQNSTLNKYNLIQTKSKTQISINKQTMKISMLMSFGAAVLLMTSCGGGGGESQGSYTPPTAQTEKPADPKGIGEIKNVDLAEGIDETMANKGKAILDMKCTACHQYNDKRLVGPGFEGVTNRRRPEWIMNMITNVEVMLDEDPVAQALLEECLTRMPNQNISVGDARDILEFLRKNDLERTGTKDTAIN
ncbi:Type IV secretory pathway, VirB6 components [Aquiflexum balticum DSM 16537]|uniref:Type IV secretory pathway, VirB6 components n=2 Tax=Aquiflexum TaxID=280472 RepID=A0A1W2HBQ2_9BACT|nr:Type IV secretory pathway, VirB6 components [Aquiflexum balticum DSM 16537]